MPTADPGSVRLVLDTNIYISAFVHPKGTPSLLWRPALQRRYQLPLSPAIASEFAGLLRETFCWPQEQVVRRKLIARTAEIITPDLALDVFAGTQEPDNRILECAVAGKANLIVSGDGDLRRLKVYRNIPIIRPVAALRILGGS